MIGRKVLERNILMILIMILVVILITAVVNYFSSTKAIQEQGTYANIALLKQITENVDTVLRMMDMKALDFINKDTVYQYMTVNETEDMVQKSRLLRNLQSSISDLQNSETRVESLYVYSLKKETVASASGYESTRKFHDLAWLDEFNSSETLFKFMNTRKATYYSSEIQGRNVISLIRNYPVTLREHADGAIVLNISERDLSAFLDSAYSKQYANIFVVSDIGQVILHKDSSEIFQDYSLKEYMESVLTNNEAGAKKLKMNNKEYYVFYCTSPLTGWKYISEIPIAEMGLSYEGVKNIIILISALIFLAATTATVIIARRIMQPFISIIDKVEQYSISDQEKIAPKNIAEWKNAFDDVFTNHQKIRVQIKKYAPYMKWRLVMDILMGRETEYGETETSLNPFSIVLYNECFIVLVVQIDEKKDIKLPKKVIGEYLEIISKKSEEFINQLQRGVAIQLYDDNAVVIISFDQKNEHINKTYAAQTGEYINSFAVENLGLRVSIGIGCLVFDMQSINQSYYNALKALKYKVFMGKNAIISADSIKASNDDELYRITSELGRLKDLMKNHDIEGIQAEVKRLFEMATEKIHDPEMIFQMSMYIVIHCAKILDEYSSNSEISITNEGSNIYQALSNCENILQIEECVSGAVIDFSKKIARENESRNIERLNSELIACIIKYIDNNYMMHDISLNFIAEKFQMSVPYLSKMFKTYVDMNFIDYLIGLRIDKAKELLENTNTKISAVAESVGYTNLASFIRIFKKHTGYTPSEFRKNNFIKDETSGN